MSVTIDLECTSSVGGKWEGKTFILGADILVRTEYFKDLDTWITSAVSATMVDDNVVIGVYPVHLDTFYSHENMDAFFCHDIMVTKYSPAS